MIDFPEVETVYGCLEPFLKKFDRLARRSRFTGSSRAAFLQWQEDSRRELSLLLGLDKMERAPLRPERTEMVVLADGITRERWVIQTEPGIFMPFYLLIPENREGAVPFLCPPGHGGAGKYTVAGLSEYPLIRQKIEQYHYDYGRYLAKHGFVTLCPDARGFGERRENPEDTRTFPGALLGDCRRLANMGNPMGIPVAGMLVWDLARAIDFLEWQGEWPVEELGCLGFSGGGMQTLFLSALDQRVKLAVISGYMYGYRDSLLRQNENCACNYVPHLWEHFDMGDIASLIAPRPLLVQSCREDRQNGPRGIDNATEQMRTVTDAYRLVGADALVQHEICEGPHQFHEEHIVERISRLKGGYGHE